MTFPKQVLEEVSQVKNVLMKSSTGINLSSTIERKMKQVFLKRILSLSNDSVMTTF